MLNALDESRSGHACVHMHAYACVRMRMQCIRMRMHAYACICRHLHAYACNMSNNRSARAMDALHMRRLQKKGRLAQWMAYYIERARPIERFPARRKRSTRSVLAYHIEWARPAHWTPATDGEVDSHNGWRTASSGRGLQRRLRPSRMMMSTPAADGSLQQVDEPHLGWNPTPTMDCNRFLCILQGQCSPSAFGEGCFEILGFGRPGQSPAQAKASSLTTSQAVPARQPTPSKASPG